MSTRPQLTTYVPLRNPTPDYTHVEVAAFYSDGGTNWVSGNRNPKGFAVSLRGVKRDPDGTTSFMMFTGWSKAFLVKPATRFSRATLVKIWAALSPTQMAALFEANDTDGLRKLFEPLAA